MIVVGKKQLTRFKTKHSDARTQVDSWLCEVEEAQWTSPKNIGERYQHASFLANNVVVFNIKGNAYRLITKVNYRNQVVLVKQILTHAQYSRWKPQKNRRG